MKRRRPVILEALRGKVPQYLAKLEAEPQPLLLPAMRSEERCEVTVTRTRSGPMAAGPSSRWRTLRVPWVTGHRHDRSLPNLTVANGLSTERLMQQLEEIEGVNGQLAALKQWPERHHFVFSAASRLTSTRMELSIRPRTCAALVSSSRAPLTAFTRRVMTKRMLAAIEDPNMDILGHCVSCCRPWTSAVRVRPCSRLHQVQRQRRRDRDQLPTGRKDPPRNLLKLALDIGCRFSIDTDAHAPGQLEWQYIGCDRAAECGVTEDRVINTNPAGMLLSWSASRR